MFAMEWVTADTTKHGGHSAVISVLRCVRRVQTELLINGASRFQMTTPCIITFRNSVANYYLCMRTDLKPKTSNVKR
jgi:hypothetical protein